VNEYGHKFAYFMILDSLISVLRHILPSQETKNQTNKEKHALDSSEHSGSHLWGPW